MIRNIGSIEGNKPAHDNDWETITKGGESVIKRWIDNQMVGKSCLILLIGSQTANRKWINYEIQKAWNLKMGIAGVYIHGIKNSRGYISTKGNNPFDYISFKNSNRKLSDVVKAYNPVGSNSKEKYEWIAKCLSAIAEEAVKIRFKN